MARQGVRKNNSEGPRLSIQSPGESGFGSRSPHWTLTFLRFANRSPSKLGSGPGFTGTTTIEPIVVVNDCIALSISEKKDGYSSGMQATIKSGDVNYLTAIGPGDYVLVNIVDGPDKAQEIRERVKKTNGARGPINRYQQAEDGSTINDGFKGLFKIQSIRRSKTRDANGVWSVQYSIVGYSHNFLQNTIYFIPQQINLGEKQNSILMYAAINRNFQNFLALNHGMLGVQDVLLLLLDSFLGTSFGGNSQGTFRTPNTTYYTPPEIGELLSVRGAKKAVDITNILIGAQTYGSRTDVSNLSASAKANPKVKLAKKGQQNKDRIWLSQKPLQGTNYNKPDSFNSVKVGDLMRQQMNALLNEMYVCHRVDPVEGIVMPTIVLREKPFTSQKGKGNTSFMNLPRWNLTPDQVISDDIGRDEAGRVNFVQVYGQSQAVNPSVNIGAQIALGNYVFDSEDVAAHGLRPYVDSTNFDFPPFAKNGNVISQTPLWKDIVADWVMGSHLKLNGTLQLAGVFEPIVPGDNVQYEGVVYHIESVTHSCQQAANGSKIFRTSLQVSHGVLAEENGQIPNTDRSFAEMTEQDQVEYIKDPNKRNSNPGVTAEEYQGEGRILDVVKKTRVSPRSFLKTSANPNSSKKKGSKK